VSRARINGPKEQRSPGGPICEISMDAGECGTSPSLQGGAVYTLRVCPFTGEAHSGGGPYAVTFPDGGAFFVCERSVHGPRRDVVRGARHERPAGAIQRRTS